MAEVKDYTSGKVLVAIKQTLEICDSFQGSLKDSKIGNRLLEETGKSDPRRMGAVEVTQLVRQSSTCAVGERVCRAVCKDSPRTESVFLDELADGMVEIGWAKYVTQEEALGVLEKYPKNPIVVSKVSGKHAEICNTWPERCVYWNLEKHGLKCISRSLVKNPFPKRP